MAVIARGGVDRGPRGDDRGPRGDDRGDARGARGALTLPFPLAVFRHQSLHGCATTAAGTIYVIQ